MTRKEKTKIIEGLEERLNSIDHFYIVNAEGLNVKAINDFRRRCLSGGIVYKVVKNTLMRMAFEKLDLDNEVDYTIFKDTVFKGFSGILLTKGASSTPAKLIKDFRKQQNLTNPLLKGASIDKKLFIGEGYLDALSKLKSKTELIGELIGLLKSPVTYVMASLQSGKHKLVGVVKALAEKRQ